MEMAEKPKKIKIDSNKEQDTDKHRTATEELNLSQENNPEQNNANASADNSSESTDSQDKPKEELSELDQARLDADKWKKEYMYLRAEFDNYRKQAIKERSQMAKYGAEKLAHDLLNVLDIFDTALRSEVNQDTWQNFKTGVEMTASEFKNCLKNHGIEEIPTDGEAFDPMIHEAISSEETEEFKPGFISRTYRKAYKYLDKTLRPAQVIVAKAPAAASGGEDSQASSDKEKNKA